MKENIDKYYRILLYVQNNMNKEKLEKIYDAEMANHLWEKFLYYDRNVLMFLNYLDVKNKKIFLHAMHTI